MIEPITAMQMRMDYGNARFAFCQPTEGDLREIALSVAREYQIALSLLLMRRKFNRIVIPRFELMLRAKEAGHSYKKIANFLGFKDHTTIMHGCMRAEENRQNLPAPIISTSPASDAGRKG